MPGILEQLDEQLTQLLAGWNSTSNFILLAIGVFVFWVILDSQDPDTHPFMLQRQSQASYTRKPRESAIYRSPEVPEGYPLRTGLQVKSVDAPAYAQGRDGDLRDIWRRVTGEIPFVSQSTSFFRGGAPPTEETSKRGKLLTVFGKDIEEHNIDELSREINVVGKHIKQHGGKRVAVYLPNSVELLSSLFAGAFYGFDIILVPYNQPHPSLITFLKDTKADALVAAAGSLPLADVTKSIKALKQVVWVVESTSRHMDWNEVPEGIGGKLEVSTWHEIVQDQKSSVGTDLPKDSDKVKPGKIVTIWLDSSASQGEVVEFTQDNIVAAVGAVISALPPGHRLSPSDTFLPAESLTHSYSLVLTLAALFSHCTVAINSVAGTGVELSVATRSISPTVIVASAESAAALHAEISPKLLNPLKKYAHYSHGRSLAAGRMPKASFLNSPARASLGTTPGKLRLLLVSERAGGATPPLTDHDLSDLRIYTGARIAYALTAARVAGAVAQTHIFDYRRGHHGRKNKHSHFGVPLSSVEVKLRDTDAHKTTDEKVEGEVVVKGPAVAGGETVLGVTGTVREDQTLAYV